jgi:hypothetical protein
MSFSHVCHVLVLHLLFRVHSSGSFVIPAQSLVSLNLVRNANIQAPEKRGKGLVLKREMSPFETGAVGFLGGALAGGLTNAWDVVKTQVMC